MTLVHSWLAGSNLLGLPVVFKTQGYDRLVVLTVMGCSFLMHLTETKHQLDPIYGRRYSYMFLCLDRVMSYLVGSYCLYRFYQRYSDIPHPGTIIMTGLVGVGVLKLGEIKTQVPLFNYIIYPCLHTIWHGCVYYVLYRVFT
jgi:predicted membrane channel-forming protein YqfA (hemolysin III family)